jgi:hypothetical protein
VQKLKIACVCIAKNEDNYIQEWVEYHLKLGFDDIVLYQNNWRTKFEHPNLIKINFDYSGGDRQVKCYNQFIWDYKSHYEYVAFFDVDEFLVLRNHKNIKDFMKDYKEHPAVCFKWFYFGNNGHTKIENNNYSVLQRFTKRGSKPDAIGKSIVNINTNGISMKVHSPDCHCFEIEPNTAQLNHYYSKTKEEFEIKKSNRVDDGIIGDLQYNNGNQNDLEDKLAYEFFTK